MRAYLVPLLLLAGSHGGSCNCAHMGSGGHVGGASHPSFGRHFSSLSAAAPAGHAGLSAPSQHLHLFHDLAVQLGRALAVGVDGIESAFGLTPSPAGDPSIEAGALNGLCDSAEDCGDGQLGHGTVCDHWSQEPRAAGLCREACRDDGDCPAPLECHWGLDPADPGWGGCLPRAQPRQAP